MKGPKEGGFTLIELMMVSSVILISVGLLLPGLFSANEQALQTQCANNLRQAAQVLNAWASEHKRFPSSFDELLEEGYVDNLDAFRCGVTNKQEDWNFKAAGRLINEMKSGDELIHCAKCNITVYMDTRVEFLKEE